MALAYRIKNVQYEIETVDQQGESTDVDLSLRGDILVVVDYIDTESPSVVIMTERFIVSSVETVEQIAERIAAFGRLVRDARVRTAELTSYVGAVVPLDDPA